LPLLVGVLLRPGAAFVAAWLQLLGSGANHRARRLLLKNEPVPLDAAGPQIDVGDARAAPIPSAHVDRGEIANLQLQCESEYRWIHATMLRSAKRPFCDTNVARLGTGVQRLQDAGHASPNLDRRLHRTGSGV